MAGKYWVDWRDGWLCVVSEYLGYDKPERELTYWPVEECTRPQAKHLIGSPCQMRSLAGDVCYVASVKGQVVDVGTSTTVQLPDYEQTLRVGGDRKPIHSENIPVPCPKLRKGQQARWYNQRWQKWTAKGWVSA